MAKGDRSQRTAGGSGGGRPPLEPTDPLTVRTALIQATILLGLPLGLLLFAKVLLRAFFPDLGY